jgi:hypothetical protein
VWCASHQSGRSPPLIGPAPRGCPRRPRDAHYRRDVSGQRAEAAGASSTGALRMAHTVLDSVVPGVEVGHRVANYRVSRTGAYPARRWLVHGGSEDAGVGRRGLLSDGRPQRTPRCLTPQRARTDACPTVARCRSPVRWLPIYVDAQSRCGLAVLRIVVARVVQSRRRPSVSAVTASSASASRLAAKATWHACCSCAKRQW